MNSEDLKPSLSQFVDGELASDEANAMLLQALQDEGSRFELVRMLQLRASLQPWRSMGEELSAPHRPNSTIHAASHVRTVLMGMAAIVAVSAAAWLYQSSKYEKPGSLDHGSGVEQHLKVATSLSREDAAEVFNLHESIAGPVAWLAILPESVRVQKMADGVEGEKADQAQAIACFLKIETHGDGVFPTLPDTIICRLDKKAVITVPSSGDHSKSMRIQLVAVHREESIGIQYAISLENEPTNGQQTSALSGFIPLSGDSNAVGRLAQAGTTLDIALSASLLDQGENG